MRKPVHRTLLLMICAIAAVALTTGNSALADTHAPSTQTFTQTCGGTTITVVSPTEHAEAAQVVGTTGTGILELVEDGNGNVLFEHPSYEALRSDKLTTCTEDGLTFIVKMNPQG
jgi:hypothetical protein